jgi:hypothetical protein
VFYRVDVLCVKKDSIQLGHCTAMMKSTLPIIVWDYCSFNQNARTRHHHFHSMTCLYIFHSHTKHALSTLSTGSIHISQYYLLTSFLIISLLSDSRSISLDTPVVTSKKIKTILPLHYNNKYIYYKLWQMTGLNAKALSSNKRKRKACLGENGAIWFVLWILQSRPWGYRTKFVCHHNKHLIDQACLIQIGGY